MADIEAVRALGYDAWLDRQFIAWPQTSHWDWMIKRYPPTRACDCDGDGDGNLPASIWRRFIEGRDVLRQKVTFALSEILVTSVNGFVAGRTNFGGASYLDMLESLAFSNYRNLLQGVSESLFMAYYLSFKGSKKTNPVTLQHPDENFARELLQLFSIGLFELENNGSPSLNPSTGEKTEAYKQSDVEALARVYTGWDADLSDEIGNYMRWKRPMVNASVNFDYGQKDFSFMPSIAAGQSPQANLKAALDGIFAHSNVGPFIGKQLIQRLVTSNPSPSYVSNVTAAFNDNGQGVRGDMKAVIRAILLDPDLFDDDGHRIGQGPDPASFGKLREPAARLIHWARAFNVRSRSGNWHSPTHAVWEYFRNVGQQPMASPSVFNFFRPDYSPPGTDFPHEDPELKKVAPEFQITTESTVVSYVTAMQTNINFSLNNVNVDAAADYSPWLPKASDPASMVNEMNFLLAAGQLSVPTTQLIVRALSAMPLVTTAQREQRVKAAVLMIVSAPEFITLK